MASLAEFARRSKNLLPDGQMIVSVPAGSAFEIRPMRKKMGHVSGWLVLRDSANYCQKIGWVLLPATTIGGVDSPELR